MDINVYMRYFEAEHVCNKVKRHAAQVILLSSSENRVVTYKVIVNFFPHNDPEDFAVSYDDYHEKVILTKKGVRSRNREAVFIDEIQEHAGELLEECGGKVFWDKPLTEARLG
ncbi:MAG: hypothetical protein J6X47_09755 [Clostridia bacterium]|nr:hypothetical protein [Clostridia bacterium]